MRVKHITLSPGATTPVKLACKSGEILVKNLTNGNLMVAIEREDFEDCYVTIPPLTGEVLCRCANNAHSPAYFFDDVLLKSEIGGEVEIRCLVV